MYAIIAMDKKTYTSEVVAPFVRESEAMRWIEDNKIDDVEYEIADMITVKEYA